MLALLKKIIRRLIGASAPHLPTWFREDYAAIKSQEKTYGSRFVLTESDFYTCLKDRTTTTPLDRHYIYHPAWAAQVLARTKPKKHVDISSTLHFSTMLSAFIETEFYDYRPAAVTLDHFHSGKADLTNLFFADNSVPSLSCMHTIEHVGLGRYGDPVDYEGDLKAMRELARVLAPGGCFLFVTPIGKEACIQFNAHRIYRAKDIADLFEKMGLTLVEFSYIPEHTGGIIQSQPKEFFTEDRYGCGCFWFTKTL